MKATIVSVVAGFAFAIPALAQINFDKVVIPSLKPSLPILLLGPKHTLPPTILSKIVTARDKICEPKCDKAGCTYNEDGRLVAYTDNDTGETSIFPDLDSLSPAKSIPLNGIQQYMKDERIFPPDDTKILAQKGTTLAANKNNSGTVTAASDYLADIWVKRTIVHDKDEFPICGPGTKAFFSFGGDGKVKALSHRWRSAQKQKSAFKPVSPSDVKDSILHQLTAAKITSATIGKIDLCYYDSGNQFIQPVLRWIADLPVLAGVTPESIVGYLAASLQPPELVPNITIAASETLTSSPTNSNITVISKRAEKRRDKINVGLYPMKNDGNSPTYESDVHKFYNALAKSNLATFIRAQDYWGKRFLYESNKERFVDSVNIALTRGHGSEHTFYTDELDPNWGSVALNDIPSSGFGGKYGFLSFWIISTCDTVTTSADYSAANFHLAYDPWWHIFNGLRAVVGFRTPKWTNDGVTEPFAKQLATGAPFMWSWLSTVNQSPHYNPNSVYGKNSETGQQIWYGRPSAVVVCGHRSDTVLQWQNVGAAKCLEQWWYY